jgi:pimeloyl-ACP methyl ester carboxylesterase
VIPYDDYAPRWREAAPDARWLTLPGVGHVPMWDDPALVVHTIRESIGAG